MKNYTETRTHSVSTEFYEPIFGEYPHHVKEVEMDDEEVYYYEVVLGLKPDIVIKDNHIHNNKNPL